MNDYQRLRKQIVMVGFICLVHSATAVPTVFNLVSNQSEVTLGGTVIQNAIQDQATGSRTTHFAGTINADVTANTIQFTGGGLIVAETNGSWQPLPGGGSGSAPACYGAKATVSLGFFSVSAVGAVRNVELSLLSPSLSITGGSFVSDGLIFAFPTNSTAAFDYNAGGVLTGSEALAGYSTNRLTPVATLSTTGGVQTLTIPVSASVPFQLVSANDSLLTLSGKIVATSGGTPPPPLSIQSIGVTNQTVTLQWQSTAGQTYQVQGSPDLKTWSSLATNLNGTGAAMTWSNNATQAVQFFRLAQ